MSCLSILVGSPPGNAVAVGAGEEVAEAGPPLRVALLLVGAVRAVLVAITVPRGRDAAVVGAAERVRRARPGGSFSAVVISSWVSYLRLPNHD